MRGTRHRNAAFETPNQAPKDTMRSTKKKTRKPERPQPRRSAPAKTGLSLCPRIAATPNITARAALDEGLQRSRVLLSHAEQIAHFGTWEYDFATRKASFSAHLLEMWGLEPGDESEAVPYWQCVPPEMKQAWAEGRPFTNVVRYRRPDGERRVFHNRGLTLRDADGNPVRAIVVVQDMTEPLRAEEEMRRLSLQLMHTRDNERRLLARQLHESAGQSLAALKMIVARLRDELPPETDRPHSLLRTTAELADAAIREVRTISYLIHPPLLDEAGLGPALRLYLRGFAERSGIQATIEGGDDFGRTDQETETILFRVVQEALTNVHRHSGSATAQVRLAREDGNMIVTVSDQGRGLPGGEKKLNRGVGIAGMLERVKHLNGEIKFESTPGQGTTVRAVVPELSIDVPEHAKNAPQHATNVPGRAVLVPERTAGAAAESQATHPVKERRDAQEKPGKRRRTSAP